MKLDWRRGARDGAIAGLLFGTFGLLKIGSVRSESTLEKVAAVLLMFLVPFAFFVLVNGFRSRDR